MVEQGIGDRPAGRRDRPVGTHRPPIPAVAIPPSRMIARTSAKSRLMRPGTVMMSTIGADGPGKDFVHDRERVEHRGVLADQVEDALVLDEQQCVDVRLELDPAASAIFRRPIPSKSNGLVTTPTVSAPASSCLAAITGAAPSPSRHRGPPR